MSERGSVRYGSTTIRYEVTRSPRRKKTVEITVDGSAGVLVAAPLDLSPPDVQAIVRKRAPWIVRKASDGMLQAFPRRFCSGESLPYLGRQVRMIVQEDKEIHRAEVRFRHWSFHVSTPPDLQDDLRRREIRKQLTAWYRERAACRLPDRVRYWTPLVGSKPSAVLIRNQKNRWASCAPDGTLRFNWRTVMVAPVLIDYIVAHELIHLDIRNHSPVFWQRLALVMPDYAERRQRLKEVGSYVYL